MDGWPRYFHFWLFDQVVLCVSPVFLLKLSVDFSKQISLFLCCLCPSAPLLSFLTISTPFRIVTLCSSRGHKAAGGPPPCDLLPCTPVASYLTLEVLRGESPHALPFLYSSLFFLFAVTCLNHSQVILCSPFSKY